MATSAAPRAPLSPGFLGIIVFKYAKAAAFLILGAAALRLARLPSHSEPMTIAHLLGVSGRNVIVQHLSFVLSALTSRQVEAIGAAAVLICLVFLAEGTLLALRVPWAPYFTIVLTALGIPAEVVEIARRPDSTRRYALLAVNIAILFYLWKRRNEFRSRKAG
ncbi:MAG TPA: DUF2127 domain-containing protein [Thermoanaerobaculia bacterium]|jgi:uncharacterized membrane protein (DUF2068 family)